MIKYLAVAFYPEHLDERRWARDIRLMQTHGINAVRVLEFAWSRLERADGEYTFDWCHRWMRLLERAGIGVVLCTPTAAPPVWLTRHHPECLAMDANGHRAHHGHRRHYCPTATVYRNYSRRIAARMQEELGGYSNVIAWQLDNEFGWNKCFCPECAAAFRQAMRAQYGTVEALNAAWGTAFWSLDFWDWDDVDLPRVGDPSPEMRLALRQFYSDQITTYMSEQVQALRAAGARAPISTNMMGDFDDIDYWHMAEPLDVVGFDNYFDIFTLAGDSLAHNLIRSLKGGRGYWTFENGVNSVGPWLQPPPGYLTIHALSALAHGEEGHTFFRWDSCRFGHEQDLQGLVDWSGRPRAALKEVKRLAALLLEVNRLKLPALQPRVAMIYSWQNYWAARNYFGKDGYWGEVEWFYQALFDLGQMCDCVRPGADLSGYDLVLAPAMQIASDAELEGLRDYVRKGGVLVAGRKCFTKLPSGSYRAVDHPALGDVFGLRVTESQDNLDTNDLTVRGFLQDAARRSYRLASLAGLPDAQTQGWFEVLATQDAQPLYTYADGYFPGQPAVCRNRFGRGAAFYVGARIGREPLRAVMRLALERAGIGPLLEVPQGLQVVQRGRTLFCTNHTQEPLTLSLPARATSLAGTRPAGLQLALPPLGFAVVRLAGRRR
jgi:beta-galactosidase